MSIVQCLMLFTYFYKKVYVRSLGMEVIIRIYRPICRRWTDISNNIHYEKYWYKGNYCNIIDSSRMDKISIIII